MVGWVGGPYDFSVSPRPLGFWFGTKGLGAKGLGPGLDNKEIRYVQRFEFTLKNEQWRQRIVHGNFEV